MAKQSKRAADLERVAELLALAATDPSYRPTIVDDAELANAFDRGMAVLGAPDQKAWRGSLAERPAHLARYAALKARVAARAS